VDQVVETTDPSIKATAAVSLKALEEMAMEVTKVDTVEDSSPSHRQVSAEAMEVATTSPTMRTKVATTRTMVAVTGEATLEKAAVVVATVVLAEVTVVISVTLLKLTEELILTRATRAWPTQHQILLSQPQPTMVALNVNNKSQPKWKVVQLLQAQLRSSPTISAIQ
jgi:hypothetical protein